MNAIRLREAAKREFRDPAPFLKRLRVLEHRLIAESIPVEVKTLRTNKLKEWREARIAALFCHGMSELMGTKIFLSKGEFYDADFLGMWHEDDGVQHFAPVQLKELVPENWNAGTTLNSLLQGLFMYEGRDDLTVVIHVNRAIHFTPETLVLPPDLPVAALWVIACLDPTHSQWALWGNFLKGADCTRFSCPT